MNPNSTNTVLFHLASFLNADNEAWQIENEEMTTDLANAQHRIHEQILWNRAIVHENGRSVERIGQMQQGARIIMEGIDSMYEIFTEMVRQHPCIAHFHDDVQRVVLRAEVGRAIMAQEVIDLTADSDEETELEEEVEL